MGLTTFGRILWILHRIGIIHHAWIRGTNGCFVTFPTFSSVHNSAPAITTFCISLSRRSLNDEKVGTLKSLDGKMYRACIRFFFFSTASKRRYASSADSERELWPGRDSLGGTTFYAITRLCFTAGGAHALLFDEHVCVCVCAYTMNILFDYATSFRHDVVTDHYTNDKTYTHWPYPRYYNRCA